MIRSFFLMAALATVAACGGGDPFNPVDETAEDPVTEPTPEPTEDTLTVPESLAGNLKSIAYDATNKTVTAQIYALDSTPVDVIYTRDATRDLNGYEAYTVQEDSLDRFFVAMVGQSTDGSVQAGLVGDGGQFNRVLQGAYYTREGDFTPPEIGTGPGAGQVSYAGNYVGITNIARPIGPDSVDPSLLPGDPVMITGQIFLNANFSDMAVNGGIFDRQVLLSTPTDLPDLALIITDIGTDGSFLGEVEFTGEVGRKIGDYGGVFGGTNASSVGGAINMEEFTDALDDELERGFFVLSQCNTPGEASICTNVAD
ncbi:hypothetical protein ACS3QZ_06215 [Shimia sp. W99]